MSPPATGRGPRASQPVVVVLRALHPGDLLMPVPALRGLHSALPGHRIVLATRRSLAELASVVLFGPVPPRR